MTRSKQLFGAACLLGVTIVAVHAWSLSAQDAVRGSADVANGPGGGASTQGGPPGGGGGGFPGAATRRPGRPSGAGTGMSMPGPAMMPGMMGRSGGMGSMAGMMMGGPSGPIRSKTVTRTVQEVVHEPIPAEELEEYQGFQNAMQALKDAKDDTEKKKAADTVREHLVKQLDRDVAQREQELAEVEERVKQLKQQLAKRKASKDDIVTLRLKTIINNAEGLGFPGDEVSQDGGSVAGSPFGGGGLLQNGFNFLRTNAESRE